MPMFTQSRLNFKKWLYNNKLHYKFSANSRKVMHLVYTIFHHNFVTNFALHFISTICESYTGYKQWFFSKILYLSTYFLKKLFSCKDFWYDLRLPAYWKISIGSIELISGRMDIAFAPETEDTGSIRGRVKPGMWERKRWKRLIFCESGSTLMKEVGSGSELGSESVEKELEVEAIFSKSVASGFSNWLKPLG